MQQYRIDRKCSIMEVKHVLYLLDNGMCGHNEVWFLCRVLARFKQLWRCLHTNILVRGSYPQPVRCTGANSRVHSLFNIVCYLLKVVLMAKLLYDAAYQILHTTRLECYNPWLTHTSAFSLHPSVLNVSSYSIYSLLQCPSHENWSPKKFL